MTYMVYISLNKIQKYNMTYMVYMSINKKQKVHHDLYGIHVNK